MIETLSDENFENIYFTVVKLNIFIFRSHGTIKKKDFDIN